jgi:hypothetical protein
MAKDEQSGRSGFGFGRVVAILVALAAPADAQNPAPSSSPEVQSWHCLKVCERLHTPRDRRRVFLPAIAIEDTDGSGAQTFHVLTKCELATERLALEVDCEATQVGSASGCRCAEAASAAPVLEQRKKWRLLLSFPLAPSSAAVGEPVFRLTFDTREQCEIRGEQISTALYSPGVPAAFSITCIPPDIPDEKPNLDDPGKRKLETPR